MKNVCIFYDHMEYFKAISYNLWPFGIVCSRLVYFSHLVCLDQEKSGNPGHCVGDSESRETFESLSRHVLNAASYGVNK
jgi:hypothetical protein